jgi:molybdopterin-guanine dinucleotide biosynthesis protein MobB
MIAWSGTGKTTLLTRVIPILKSRGLNIALIKHAHHLFDIDSPGKDSYRLRKAGANQVVIASKKRVVTISETPENDQEPVLENILQNVVLEDLDMVLVEGFKMADIPKIELHRQALAKSYLYPEDKNIIAIAQDMPTVDPPKSIASLDLNNPEQIANFIFEWLVRQRSTPPISLAKQ